MCIHAVIANVSHCFSLGAMCSGDIPEEAFYQQQKLQVDVLDLFRLVDQAANGARTANLPKREIRVLLKGRFPHESGLQK